MIECKDIKKSYDGRPVLEGFSFTFPDTGFFLLLGESGSGKTTLLNILSGVIPPDGGSVEAEGERVEYITQDASFVDFLSVLDNLRLISDEEGRIRELLTRYGLKDAADRLPLTLSGGERQRVALLRAILGGKGVLLLDEPTASLDEAGKRAVFGLLSELKGSALILCASHDKAALEYADHTILFSKSGITTPPEPASAAPKKREKIQERETIPKADPTPFLRKWFTSPYRSRRTSALFFLFLTIASCAFLFADTPKNKEAATLENFYGVNMLRVRTENGAKPLTGPEVAETVLEYAGSCPDGNEDLPPEVLLRPSPDYELSLHTVPFQKEAFPLADRLRYGRYFSHWNEILLPWEVALALSPEDPGAMVGRTVSVRVYELGPTDFTVAGVFGPFTEAEKAYLRAADLPAPREGVEAQSVGLADMFFFNSKLTALFEDDPDFGFGSGRRRGYVLYFEDHGDMERFYDRVRDRLPGDVDLENCGEFLFLADTFEPLFWIALPAAVFLAVFATLMFTALGKIQLSHNAGFIAVFEYSEYKKSDIISRFIRLNVQRLILNLLWAMAAAAGIALLTNAANRRFGWVNFQLFTFNPWMLTAFALLISGAAWGFTAGMYRRVRVKSWYELLIDSRDLL